MLDRRDSEDIVGILQQLYWVDQGVDVPVGPDSVKSSGIFECKEISHLALEDKHTAMPWTATDVGGL